MNTNAYKPIQKYTNYTVNVNAYVNENVNAYVNENESANENVLIGFADSFTHAGKQKFMLKNLIYFLFCGIIKCNRILRMR